MTRTFSFTAQSRTPSFRRAQWRGVSLLFLLLAVLFAAFPASAQVPTGTPPFGSFGGGPDVINLANLNSHLTIPVFNKPGRGMNFNYNLTYDSSIWYPVGSSGSQSWHLVSSSSLPGWQAVSRIGQSYVGYSMTYSSGQCTNNGSTFYTWTNSSYSGFYYYDQFGVRHNFGNLGWAYITNSGAGICGPAPGWYPGSAQQTLLATDASGLTLYVTPVSSGAPAPYLIATNGAKYNPPVVSGSASGSLSVTDRNGNQLSVDGSGNFYDTLSSSTPVLTVAGAAPSNTTFTYTAPSGSSAAFTMKYSAYTLQTAFGCSGISEYGPTPNTSLVSEIDLPDNSKYTFTYEPTPGVPGNVTGRLASVTLPTGGTIYYTYTGGTSGHITCSDGSASGLTRQTPDGTWNYARSIGTGAASTTTITDATTPTANQTVIQFQGLYETQRQTYQGSTSGTLLQTTNTCYNSGSSSCTGTAVALPITQVTVTTQLPGASNLTSQCIYKYSANGSLTERDDYDFGSGAPGALLKKTAITLASLGNITAFQQQVIVTNVNGVAVSQTFYNYDETAVVSTSGTPQHTSVASSRGNLTSISYATNGLVHHFTYFDTGNTQTFTDVNGAQTTYTYGAGSCGNSFPTSVSEPLSMSRSFTWNCTGGVSLTATDENNQITTTAYTDPYFWRPASAADPTNATATFTYPSSPSYNTIESKLLFNGGNSATDALTTVDSLGRAHVQQIRQSPSSSNFDSAEVDYDALGRPSRSTTPYVGTAGQTNSSAPAVATTYDALGRPLTVTDAGGGVTSYSYNQNDVLITVGPAPTGENTKRRQLEYDGLGRLTSVCEITTGPFSGTCGQTVSTTGYWTKYTYDAVGRLTSVTQNTQPNGTAQTRSYAYDDLGRLTSESNPETGATAYTYDSVNVGVCAVNNPGDLVLRTDAAGVSACYVSDVLHRVLSVGHNPGQAGSTPDKFFLYDSATVNGVVMTNAKGHLAEAYTCLSPCTKVTDVGFSYSARGEVTDVYQSTPHSGGYYHLAQTYWPHGAPYQLSGTVGIPTISYGVDGEGRTSTTSASSGQNPVTGTTYNAFNQPTQVNLGSLDSDAFTYDANTGRMTQYQFNVNGQSVTGALTWNANSTLQKLVIADPFNSANAQTCNYSHDDLTRISAANCGAAWSQTFAYDPFGNLTKSGSMSFQPTYSATTNRMTSLPGFTPVYDANGNVLTDNSHVYTWNADNRPLTQDGIGMTYDAFTRVVEQNRSGVYTEIVYAPTGEKLALMSGQTLQKAFIPLPGNVTAVYTSSGLSRYRHPDWLGSARFGSTPSRTMYSDVAYAPFGEPYALAGANDLSFTGINQDTDSDSFDFLARQYSTQGRWASPDPAGLAAVNPAFPQSWNRYGYVLNTPDVLIDPLGLDPQNGTAYGAPGNNCYLNGMVVPCDVLVYYANAKWGTGPGAVFDIIAAALTSTGDARNPDWWSNKSCVEHFEDCNPGVSPFLPVYGNIDLLRILPLYGSTTASGGADGGCVQSVFNPSCKRPTCIEVFIDATAEADFIPIFPAGLNAHDAPEAAAQAAAARHIVKRGLVVPLRSSIVRSMFAWGEFAASAVFYLPAIYQMSIGLNAEYQARKARTCRTAGEPK